MKITIHRVWITLATSASCIGIGLAAYSSHKHMYATIGSNASTTIGCCGGSLYIYRSPNGTIIQNNRYPFWLVNELQSTKRTVFAKYLWSWQYNRQNNGALWIAAPLATMSSLCLLAALSPSIARVLFFTPSSQRCPNCLYDLKGLPSENNCPECGHSATGPRRSSN